MVSSLFGIVRFMFCNFKILVVIRNIPAFPHVMEVAEGYQFIENWIYFIILRVMVIGATPSLSHDAMAPKLWLFVSLLSVSLGLRKN